MVTGERARKAFDIAERGGSSPAGALRAQHHRPESPSGKASGRSRSHIRHRACRRRRLGRPPRHRESHEGQGTCLRPRPDCSGPGPSPARSGPERPRRGHGRVRPNAAVQRVRIPRREHLPDVMNALIAGEGLNVGQVIGASNSKGEYPSVAPTGRRMSWPWATATSALILQELSPTSTDAHATSWRIAGSSKS